MRISPKEKMPAVITIIKLCKYIYINPLTILIFIVSWFNRRLGLICTAYSVMLIHELAHLAAAVIIGLKPSYICFHPFGVNLKLKNRIVYSLADEIILYFSGPMVNIVLAFVSAVIMLKITNPFLDFFRTENIALFIINMLPVFPLDGGVILKKIISYKTGAYFAEKIMRIVSIVITAILIVLLGYSVYIRNFNYSALFFAVFLIANIFTQKEKYNADAVKEVLMYKQKKYGNKKVRFKLCTSGCDLHKLIKEFRADSFYILIVLDEKGRIDEFLTEREIMERLLKKR